MGHNFLITTNSSGAHLHKTKKNMLFFVYGVLVVFAVTVQGKQGVGGGEQDWGYITVRPNAHMFWWLYYTTYNNVSNYTERPLIIWLQGGPGMPSTGYGNFLEVGPLNASFAKRKGSFTENYNVLFIDNPVGVGYSYISDSKPQYVTKGSEIGEDLYTFLKIFIDTQHTEFKKVPIYIFGESYGGKMAVELVYKYIKKENNSTEKLCNLKGVALGDAYISPIDYINHYGPLALELGLVDKRGFTRIDELAKQIQLLISKKEFKKAARVSNIITDKISGVDMNNFVGENHIYQLPKVWDNKELLEEIMNGKVKETLNITANVTWKFVEDDVYNSLRNDLIKSVTHKVETILKTSDIKVIVYNGVLDYLVNTAGTISWLDSLNWKGRERWFNQNQTALIINEVWEGYLKRVDHLVFYAILRAGHSVPMDNLKVMNFILQLELD